MIICLQTRQGEIHYISWDSPARGYYFVMCGKSFFKKDHLSIFSIDESIPDACINCRKSEEYPRDSRNYHSGVGSNTMLDYLDLQAGWKTPKQAFEDLLDRRLWAKLRRMKNKINKRKPAPAKKPKKHKRFYESGQSKRK
jgi:hypothetical protein